MLKLIFIVQMLYVSAITASSSKMELVYEWSTANLEFELPSPLFGYESLAKGTFIPAKFSINGLEVYENKVFITLPWYGMDSVTVAYVNLNETSTMSPKFMPYPSWGAYLPDERGQRWLGQVFRARVDRCDRLWLLEKVSENYSLHIIVIDLKTDTIIRTYTFPAALIFRLYAHWIVVEDRDCKNTFAYVNDYWLGGFWTYSWAENDSWHIDGYNYINAMILAPNCDDGFSTLHYQTYSIIGFHETYFVSTQYLRDKTTALSTVHLSNQKSEAVYLRAATFNPATNVLYSSYYPYLKNLRVSPCWNEKTGCPVNGISELTINVDIYTYFGDDMTVDRQGNLWIEVIKGYKTALLKFSPPANYKICKDASQQVPKFTLRMSEPR